MGSFSAGDIRKMREASKKRKAANTELQRSLDRKAHDEGMKEHHVKGYNDEDDAMNRRAHDEHIKEHELPYWKGHK